MKVVAIVDCYSHEMSCYSMIRLLCKALGDNVIVLPLSHCDGQPFHLQLLVVEYEHTAAALSDSLSHTLGETPS